MIYTTDSDRSTKDFYLSFLLPHTEKLSTGEEYTISMEYIKDGAVQINVKTNNCGDSTIKETAENAAKSWLSNHDFNPNSYIYYVPTIYNNCLIK